MQVEVEPGWKTGVVREREIRSGGLAGFVTTSARNTFAVSFNPMKPYKRNID